MKKSKKDPIYRIGDKVKIINPEIFVRCGYPLSKKDIENEFLNDKQKIVAFNEFISKIGLDQNNYKDLWLLHNKDCYSDILDAVFYNILKIRRFGGNERKIYTEIKSELKDKIVRVSFKRIVNTGIRVEGSHCQYGWDGEYEYNPPYLDKQKSNVILYVQNLDTFDSFEIEEKNVEKYVEK